MFLKLWDLSLETCGYFCRYISHRHHVADFKLLWPAVEHDSRCRCKVMAVWWRLRGAPPFGEPTKAWVSEFLPNIFYWRLDSVVGTIARLQGLDEPRFAFRRGWKIFLFLRTSWPVLGSTQPPSQRVPGVLSPGIKRLGLAADHSPPSSAEVKSKWSYSATVPVCLHAEYRDSFTFNIFFKSKFLHCYICSVSSRLPVGKAPKFVFIFGPQLCLSSFHDCRYGLLKITCDAVATGRRHVFRPKQTVSLLQDLR